jgi:hypothetical protein
VGVRPPFLDRRIVEFTLTVPDEYRLRAGKEKHLPGETFRDLLPGEVGGRQKRGSGTAGIYYMLVTQVRIPAFAGMTK